MLNIVTVNNQTAEVAHVEGDFLAFIYVDIYVASGNTLEVLINDKTFLKQTGSIAGKNFGIKVILGQNDVVKVYCDGSANVFVHGFTYQP